MKYFHQKLTLLWEFAKNKKPEHNEMNFNVQVLTLKNKILLQESVVQLIIFADRNSPRVRI